MIIGITGGTGSGKTTFLKVVEEMGGLALDCDAIYHELLRTDKGLLDAIDARFPGVVKEGVLDRKALGELVFSDEAALKDLNEITHSAVKKEVLLRLQNAPSLVAIDAIGLFESGLNELCDTTVAVIAPIKMQIERVCQRDGVSFEYAKKRIFAQKQPKTYASLCQHQLHNDKTEEIFREKCLAFLRRQIIMK
jgi:dephospho-CoA kinase